MITLYGYRSSPCAAKVRAVLADMAIARDSKLVKLVEKEDPRPEHLKFNPERVVLAMIDDGKTILATTTLLEYLDTT